MLSKYDIFCKVVEHSGFTKAANAIQYSQSAVSQTVKNLEQELGLTLLTRGKEGIHLTADGEAIFPYIQAIANAEDALARRQREMQGLKGSVIRIGTSLMTPAQVLVDLWPRLHDACPDIRFQLIPFDNTPENAREILANLGQNIDVVAGIFDETMLSLRNCAGLELSREPICCAVSLHHRLAQKDRLSIQDLYGEKLMLMRRNWSRYVDLLRDDIWNNHPQIQIVDFDFYDVDAFNRCENENYVLMAVENWRYVHPLLKILPVDWNYTIPFGLLHSPSPSAGVSAFLRAVEKTVKQEC